MIHGWDDVKDRYKNGKLLVGNTLSCYLNEPLDYDHPKNIVLDEIDNNHVIAQLLNHPIFEEFPRKVHKEQLKTTKKFLRMFFHDTPLLWYKTFTSKVKILKRLMSKNAIASLLVNLIF